MIAQIPMIARMNHDESLYFKSFQQCCSSGNHSITSISGSGGFEDALLKTASFSEK